LTLSSHSIVDNLVALLRGRRAWNCSAASCASYQAGSAAAKHGSSTQDGYGSISIKLRQAKPHDVRPRELGLNFLSKCALPHNARRSPSPILPNWATIDQ